MPWLILSGSNYPYLEQISMVPKTFKPLRFHCIWKYRLIFTYAFFAWPGLDFVIKIYSLMFSGPHVCTSHLYGVRTIVGVLPAWFRFAQCLRRYRDTKLVFPHVVNAGKYSTSFFTALFSTLYHVQKGKWESLINSASTALIRLCQVDSSTTNLWNSLIRIAGCLVSL